MAHDPDGIGDDLPARREAREEKDRIKAEFGARLRVLLDLTGLSSREFANRFPAYKDSTVRKYTLGTNLPPWDFLHDLLTEVARRTDDPAAPQRRTELFTAYRTVLVDTGATIRGSDQNSLLLRLLDGEEALHRLGAELAEVRARENQLRTDLEEEIHRAAASPSTGSQDRKHQLEGESRALGERRDELVRRRGALVTELDDCRARLAVLEGTGGSGDLVPASGGGAGVDQPRTPPKPPKPPVTPGRKSGGRRTVMLTGIALAVVLLAGGGAALGIWATGTHDRTAPAATPSPPPTTSEPTPATTTPAATTPAPSSAEPGTEAEPSTEAPTPSDPAALYESSPPSGTSLVNDLPAFEDDGYQAGAQKVNLREYPVALRNGPCGSIATWQLDRTYKSLVAGIGVSDDSGTGASAEFTITVDDHTRFQRTIKVGESAQTATVDLSGAFRVTLTIDTCSGTAAWLDPVITK
ncbi:NPCBM/NEW2 domain-containing protein [Streptomyces sp. NPDC002911]